MENEERIIRNVKAFGNGAHILVPKLWEGERVILLKPLRKSLKEEILEVIGPYLENIIGVYIYGSYSRNEQREDSDIDLFVITNKKIKIKEKGFEILCMEEKNIKKSIELEPLLMHSIISESKPIINIKLLDELKEKYRSFNIRNFNEFLKSTKNIIKVNKEFLSSENKEYVSGEAIIYSLILRLRGVYIANSLLNKKSYSNKDFKVWVKNKLPNIDFDSIYENYISSKNNEKLKFKVKINDLILLLDFLSKQIFILENGKKRKET